MRQLLPCGTSAAYQRHLKAGERPCGPCREAKRQDRSRYNRGRPPGPTNGNPPGPSTGADCGTQRGYQRHRTIGEPTCQPCRDAENASMRALRAQQHPRCGTKLAAASHRARGETCETCRVDGRVGRTVDKPHGTPAAVRRHEYRREQPCDPCREVQRQIMRDRRTRAKARRAAGVNDPT